MDAAKSEHLAYRLESIVEPATSILATPEAREKLNAEIDAMEFLGKLSCSHHRLEAGAVEEVLIDYEVGSSGITDSGGVKLCFKFYSDWELQCSAPDAANYCSVEYTTGSKVGGATDVGTASLRQLRWRYDNKGGERPYQKALIIDLVDGYLRPGDHILVRLGDRRQGGPGTRVQTFVEDGFRFRMLVDPLGTQRYGRGPEAVLDVVAGAPNRLVTTARRLVSPNSKVVVRSHVEDRWGNPLRDFPGEVSLAVRGALQSDCLMPFPDSGFAAARTVLEPEACGELVIDATLAQVGLHADPVYVAVEQVEEGLSAWFGDLHVHTNDTVGTNDNEYNFSYAKDVAGLDFMGYTANDFQITDQRWERVVDLAEKFTQDGDFVCFPGVEWCGTPGVGGDHNVVFIGSDTTLARCVEWHEEMGASQPHPKAWPISRLYAAYESHPEQYLLIPHVGGRRAVLDWHHPELERLVEVHSAWGPDPWFFEDAMRRGLKVGASGASDEHRGRPGAGHPGANIFGSRGGLCGVLSDSLDRASLGTALRARHTWATTGSRAVALAWSSEHQAIQGDCITLAPESESRAEISYLFLCDPGWEELSAFDSAGLLWRRDLDAEVGYGSHLIRIRWGGARVKDRYRWVSWRGRAAFSGTALDSVTPWAFHHEENRLWRDPSDPSAFGWSGRTYGDMQGAVVGVRDLDSTVISIAGEFEEPGLGAFSFEVGGEELVSVGRITRRIGGVDVVVVAELLAEAPLPRRVSGSFEVTAQGGQACVYLRGRQRDGHEVWTSPIFCQAE